MGSPLRLAMLIVVALFGIYHRVQGFNRLCSLWYAKVQRTCAHCGDNIRMAFNNDDNKKAVVRVATNGDINNVAKFLSVSMYADNPIPLAQQKELYRLEFQDLKSRYSSLSAVRGYYSSLLLAEIEGEIVGAVGLDCQILNRDLNKFSKLTVNSLAYLDSESEEIVIVLANLAVRSDQRRRGIGKLLLQNCETYAKSYISTSNQEPIDNKSIYLTVDSENQKAIKLYKQNGYKVVFEDENATCVVSGEFSLKTKDCINLCLKKSVGSNNGNILQSIFRIF